MSMMTTSCFFHRWQSRMQNEKYIYPKFWKKSSKVWNFGRQIAKLPQEVLIIEKLLLSTFPLVKRWIWSLSTHLQRAYEVAVIVTSWLMMDWVVGSTNLPSTKCCYWWCLCLRWLTSPMRDAQSLEQSGKAWYIVGWRWVGYCNESCFTSGYQVGWAVALQEGCAIVADLTPFWQAHCLGPPM